MRYLPILAFAAACTTTEATDTGQLVGIEDRMFAECQDGTSFSCGVRVTVTDGQVVATGVFEDGRTGGPSATGALTEAAQLELSGMIGQIPLSTPSTIHEAGCGGAPLRATGLDVMFDHDGLRHFDVQYAGEGPMQDLNDYVMDLVTEIRLCSSSRMTFDACQANTR